MCTRAINIHSTITQTHTNKHTYVRIYMHIQTTCIYTLDGTRFQYPDKEFLLSHAEQTSDGVPTFERYVEPIVRADEFRKRSDDLLQILGLWSEHRTTT